MNGLWAFVWFGCVDEEQVAADMERALSASQIAMVGALVTTEVLSHTFDVPDTQLRHGSSCGCPCTERTGENPPWVMTLDYHDTGCVPDSGLLPTTLAGIVVLEWDGVEASAAFQGVTLGLEHAVTGSLSGPVTSTPIAIDAVGSLGLGDESVDLDLSLVVDEGITLDGEATVAGKAGGRLDFKDLDLPLEQIGPPCPTPIAGRITLTNDDDDVVVSLAKPGDGIVTVETQGRVSEAVDWCAWRSDLL